MAAKDYLAFNPRLERLVVEVRTEWPADLLQGKDRLSSERLVELGRELHRSPSACGTVRYDRVHTGFTRVVTVTDADRARLGLPGAAGADVLSGATEPAATP